MADSFTLTLSGTSSVLEARYFPPIELTNKKNWTVGLVELLTYNSIPNIDEGCNKFYINKDGKQIAIIIPTGNYEIQDIEAYLKKRLGKRNIPFNLKADNVTLKIEIQVPSDISLDFRPDDSIGRLLGFKKEILTGSPLYKSHLPADIIHVNSLRIECNITAGSYINDKRVHTIHEFFPSVPPGYKIIEVPAQVIYLPIVGHSIDQLQLKIVDQDGRLVNFRGEVITIRLHIRAN